MLLEELCDCTLSVRNAFDLNGTVPEFEIFDPCLQSLRADFQKLQFHLLRRLPARASHVENRAARARRLIKRSDVGIGKGNADLAGRQTELLGNDLGQTR